MDEQTTDSERAARTSGVAVTSMLPAVLRPRGPSGYARNLVVLAGRGLVRTTSRWVAVGCWTLAAAAVLLIYTPNGIDTVAGRVVTGLASALAVVAGAMWWWRGWPTERRSLAFAVGVDITYTC